MAARNLMAHVEETVSDSFRAMEYLYAKDGGGLRGAERARFLQMSEEERHLRGVEFASKVFVNFDRATPKERQSVSAGDFLEPHDRKYPYKVNGKISCNLLKAAMSRSAQNKEMDVHTRAQRLFSQHCGGQQ